MNAMRAWVLEGELDSETNDPFADADVGHDDNEPDERAEAAADRELDAAFERFGARRECGA